MIRILCEAGTLAVTGWFDTPTCGLRLRSRIDGYRGVGTVTSQVILSNVLRTPDIARPLRRWNSVSEGVTPVQVADQPPSVGTRHGDGVTRHSTGADNWFLFLARLPRPYADRPVLSDRGRSLPRPRLHLYQLSTSQAASCGRLTCRISLTGRVPDGAFRKSGGVCSLCGAMSMRAHEGDSR